MTKLKPQTDSQMSTRLSPHWILSMINMDVMLVIEPRIMVFDRIHNPKRYPDHQPLLRCHTRKIKSSMAMKWNCPATVVSLTSLVEMVLDSSLQIRNFGSFGSHQLEDSLHLFLLVTKLGMSFRSRKMMVQKHLCPVPIQKRGVYGRS